MLTGDSKAVARKDVRRGLGWTEIVPLRGQRQASRVRFFWSRARAYHGFGARRSSVPELENHLGSAHEPQIVARRPLHGCWVVFDSSDLRAQLPDLLR
jgi:hypothetical protein